jgi:cyclopropane fatty-acyl-phospholipid synthase-like methyltransferase
VSDPRTRIVGEGYDAIAGDFDEWRGRIEGDPRERWREELASRLPDGAGVLELGCGSGVPDARALAERFEVTGVELSVRQLELARANVPGATFVQGDLTAVEFPSGSFDAVAAFYVLNHVPRELLAPLFARVRSWLAPGGLFLASFGTSDTESWVGEWLGTTTFFSSFPPETTSRLVREAGFELLLDELVPMREPDEEEEAPFHWVLARRP